MFDGKFRKTLDAGTAPIGRVLVKIGFSPDVLTALGLVFAVATGWAIGSGHHWFAIVLLLATGLHDMFDGAVAKASDRASQRGSYFDSVIDRISDAALLMGAAYYLTAHNRGQLVLLPFAILTTTFLISYQRSKAESLGLTAKGGLMERAERMILMGVALLAKPIFIPVLWLMLVLTTMTALGRFMRVWKVAASPPPQEHTPLTDLQNSIRRRRGLSRASRR